MNISKALSKKLKSNRLRQLKHYCQMCEKQCGDDLGFRRHCKSEGHLRMMQVFSENPQKYMSQYSRDFEKEFMQLLSTQFCGKRILANTAYQEYIRNRHHLHMNSTNWGTLTQFCEHLASSGKIKIEDTEQGLYITHIDTRPSAILLKTNQKIKRAIEGASEIDGISSAHKMLKRDLEGKKQTPLVIESKQTEPETESTVSSGVEHSNTGVPIKFSLKPSSSASKSSALKRKNVFKTKLI